MLLDRVKLGINFFSKLEVRRGEITFAQHRQQLASPPASLVPRPRQLRQVVAGARLAGGQRGFELRVVVVVVNVIVGGGLVALKLENDRLGNRRSLALASSVELQRPVVVGGSVASSCFELLELGSYSSSGLARVGPRRLLA